MDPKMPCGPCKEFGVCPPLPDCERQPDDKINSNYNCCTLCAGDKKDNCFYVNGQCLLDQLTWEQLYIVLRRYPNGVKDLERITSDPVLLKMAREARLEMDELESDKIAADRINKNNTLPLYMVFRGNFNGDVM